MHHECLAYGDDIAPGTINNFRHSLLDHLVRAEQQFVGDCDAEHLGGFAVDQKLEFRRLLDRQVARFCAFEYLVHLTGQSPDAFAVKSAVFDLVVVHHDFIIMHCKPAGVQPLSLVIRLKQGVRQCQPVGACPRAA